MKNRKIKRTLSAATLFILFGTGCRGSWDAFNEEMGNSASLLDGENAVSATERQDPSFFDAPFSAHDPLWNMRYFNTVEPLARQEEQTAEYAPGPSTEGDFYTLTNMGESVHRPASGMREESSSAQPEKEQSFFSEAYDRPSTSQEEYRMHNGENDLIFVSKDLSNDGYFQNDSDMILDNFDGEDQTASRHSQPLQCADGSNPVGSPSSKECESPRQIRGKKRKIDEPENPADYPLLRSLLEKKKEKKETPLKKVSYSEYQKKEAKKSSKERVRTERATKIRLDQLDIGIWNEKRLTSLRRRGYKSKHRTIYSFNTFNKNITTEFKTELFQKRLRKSIEDFSAQLSSNIEKNALWYFIASGSTNI
ncbi:hypothetical protein NEMIN01_2330, partial [Nematocida minor]|uniref:uncharacterized protein n=1 Tax=Nematocida minor TaxID=1912983 RepID=UPI00222064E4